MTPVIGSETIPPSWRETVSCELGGERVLYFLRPWASHGSVVWGSLPGLLAGFGLILFSQIRHFPSYRLSGTQIMQNSSRLISDSNISPLEIPLLVIGAAVILFVLWRVSIEKFQTLYVVTDTTLWSFTFLGCGSRKSLVPGPNFHVRLEPNQGFDRSGSGKQRGSLYFGNSSDNQESSLAFYSIDQAAALKKELEEKFSLKN